MAANTNPIYTFQPDAQVGAAVLGPSANTATDGTGANITSVFQANTVEGGFVTDVRLKAVGSPAATVARLFLHALNGAFTPGTTNTAANTSLMAEIALPAITLSQVAATPDFVIPVMRGLNPGYRLLLTFGTSTGAAGNGYAVTTFGGRY